MDVRKTLSLALLIGCLSLSTVALAESTNAPGLLAGKVHASSLPLSSAGVYVYQLADLTFQKVTTDNDGNFLFRELPAGLYKIIAHKGGFLPAVITLARSSSTADQFVDLELVEQDAAKGESADFWTVRKRIPTDVLRELGIEDVRLAERRREDLERLSARNSESPLANLQTKVQALAGIHQGAGDSVSQMSGGRLELDGRVGLARIAFDGFYLGMAPSAKGPGTAVGQRGHQSAMTFDIQGDEGNSQLSLAARSSRLSPSQIAGSGGSMDFEQLLVSFKAPLGSKGESRLSARYTTQNNFYSSGEMEPADIPDASRIFDFESSYSRQVGSDSTFEGQLRYREREGNFLPKGTATLGNALVPIGRFADESVELSGRGGWRLQPAVLVEYGLTSRLHDGSLSFTPRGGLVLQMGEFWQAGAEASYRLDADELPRFRDFVPALFHDAGSCDQAEASCYKVAFHRLSEDDVNRVSFSTTHKEYGETLRVYFSEDFFDHLESLFLVRGDRLPEMQFSLRRRISPKILTTLESNIAAGGGGLIYSSSDLPFENQLRYLVTSLDTQFQNTSTGVLLSFHHLQQELVPTSNEQFSRPQMEVERLQLRVTQDLGFLMDLAADWAVHLNVEVSRGSAILGSSAAVSQNELRQRFLGGLAVRF